MNRIAFPVIDPVATGENIQRLRRERGLSVRDLQMFFGFEEPQAIYKWQRGKSLPSVDNLYALSALLDVSMDDIIVSRTIQLNRYNDEQQAAACCSAFLRQGFNLFQIKNKFFLSRAFRKRIIYGNSFSIGIYVSTLLGFACHVNIHS